uniref:Uncharacterized protein n=1 Tax=Glycine max TaxID=3847 RepID=I1KW92_SOYBN
MHHICVCCKGLTPLPPPPPPLHQRRNTLVITFASKSGGGFSLNSLLKSCKSCGGKGAIECPGCKVPCHEIHFQGSVVLFLYY